MPQLTELYRYMFPLLTEDDGQPDVLGTAFIVVVDRLNFVVTAAHVVEAGGSTAIRMGRGIVANPGSVEVATTAMPPSGNRDDDPVDVAVWRADAQVAAALFAEGVQPIAVVTARIEDVAESGDHYVFSGFPSSRTRINRAARMIDPGPVSASCAAVTGDRLASLGFNPTIHILGEFEHRRMANPLGQQVTAPEPWGMSGGPVWKKQGNECTLVGVGIEYREPSGVLVATRLGAVVALLRGNFPETRPHLAEPLHFTAR